MIHLENLSAIHSQGNLSDCALHAVGALGAYRRRWSHDGHSAAVMTKPHCRVLLPVCVSEMKVSPFLKSLVGEKGVEF